MQIEYFNLGMVHFKKSYDFQKEIFEAVKCQNLTSALILCQHYPAITLGRISDRKNILMDEQELSLRGIQIYETERGGDVTYHGPGQLTVYPIFNLSYFKKDIHLFLRYLEEVVIELLFDFGIKGIRIPGLTGIWVNKSRTFLKVRGKQKIASIGIAIKNWITFHGLSINIKKNDLDNFCLIRPCGMDMEMTSLETVLERCIQIDDIKERIIQKFRATFMIDLIVPVAT